MRMRNEIAIAAPAAAIYKLASATERWPQILPHYRYVRILEQNGNERLVEMAARRGFIPVRWRARQRNDPETPLVHFTHTAGWTRGMEVAWRFGANGQLTVVTIEHDLDFAAPLLNGWIGDAVIGRFFIDRIASQTLRCMKEQAERWA